MIPFPFNENRFSFLFFFCCRPYTSWPVVYKSQERQETSIKSESDTMFNERDQSYDNRTIASSLKMQIWIATNKRGRTHGDGNKVSGYGYDLWCGSKWGPRHATSHLRSRLESQRQSVPGCVEECDDPLVESVGRWQTLGVAAGLGTSPQVQRDPGLASEGVLWLWTLLSLAPSSPDLNPLDYFVWEHHQHDLPQHQNQSDRYHPPSICRAPSSGSVSWRWLRLKAATLNKYQLYYIIKLPEWFSLIKVLK